MTTDGGKEEHQILPVYTPNTDAAFNAYKEEHKESVSDVSAYWSDLAKRKLDWFAPYTSVRKGSFVEGDVAWFLDGKINACYNALDRHCKGDGSAGDRSKEVAILWEGDEPNDVRKITFEECLRKVCKIANALKASGVQKGDVVTLYMPMIPELAMTMLACARIGAAHSVIFAGFSADAIADRITSSSSRWVVTADGGKRGGRNLPLKQICDTAIAKGDCAKIVQKVFVFEHTGPEDVQLHDRDVQFDSLIESQRPYCPCEWMDSEDTLFILYTSGSTGKPKGLVHTTGGYCMYALQTTAVTFDLKKTDVYACVADAGWITGHTYIVYGPLLNGASTFMFESTPMYPDNGRYWDMIERHKITVFYTAPTAIRSLMRFGDEAPKKYDLSSLRILGSVGEPINPEAWRWYYEVIGNSKCAVVDTYWQTETGGHVVTNLPGVTPMKPGSCTLPFYGIDTVVLDPRTGKEIEGNGVEGVLAIKQPWPGMTRTCLGDHERYLTVYMTPYPGYYFPGDGCKRDEDGFIWITGRVDDVLNVSGHRIGTAEVESALVGHPAVAQAAVIGYPHDIKGQGICCYATLTVGYDESDELVKELRTEVSFMCRFITLPLCLVLRRYYFMSTVAPFHG
uniref:Acetyl-coenzyme A synthetase n=1 Tax=Odontella aurita TaxID=265563 RepID=A0A7S4K1G5_9STRA